MSGIKHLHPMHRRKLFTRKKCFHCNKKLNSECRVTSSSRPISWVYIHCSKCGYSACFKNNILYNILSFICDSPNAMDSRYLVSYFHGLGNYKDIKFVSIIDDDDSRYETEVLVAKIHIYDFKISYHIKYKEKLINNLILE